jgi:leucyl aminopeptidase
LIDTVKKAAEAAGDKMWQLPLTDEYRELMKGETADLKNTSGTRAGGTITAAAFLSEFTEKYPWAHIDIAPTAFIDKPWPYIGKGATGAPVRTVLNFLKYFEPPRRGRART